MKKNKSHKGGRTGTIPPCRVTEEEKSLVNEAREDLPYSDFIVQSAKKTGTFDPFASVKNKLDFWLEIFYAWDYFYKVFKKDLRANKLANLDEVFANE